jgi:hypothetical protein
VYQRLSVTGLSLFSSVSTFFCFPLACKYNKYITVNLFFHSLHVTCQLLSQIIYQLIKLYWNFLLRRTIVMNAVANTVRGLIFKTMCLKLKCFYSFELLWNNRMTSLLETWLCVTSWSRVRQCLCFQYMS